MKKIKIILLLSALAMSLSCNSIKSPLSDNSMPKPGLPSVDLQGNVENASLDAHIRDEKAVVVSVFGNGTYYIGSLEYNLGDMVSVISKRLKENPSEGDLVYLNIYQSAKFDEAAKALDAIRKCDVENIGLGVYRVGPATGANLGILKVKMLPEPRMEGDNSTWNNRQFIKINKDGKIFFGSSDSKGNAKLEKTEIKEEEVGAKISSILSGKDNKAFHIIPSRSADYRRIIHLIDVATGAGASTVYLQIDILED